MVLKCPPSLSLRKQVPNPTRPPLSKAAASLCCHLLSSPVGSRVFPCHSGAPGLPALTLESEANPLVAQTYAGKPTPLVSRLCMSPPEPSAISLWRIHRTGWHWPERKSTKTLVDVKTLIGKDSSQEELLSFWSIWGCCCFPSLEYSGQHKACRSVTLMSKPTWCSAL